MIARVSDPHPFHADLDPDPGFEICADPVPGLDFFKTSVFYANKSKKNFGSGSKCGSGSRDLKKCGSGSWDSKNADPMRIRIRNPDLVTVIFFCGGIPKVSCTLCGKVLSSESTLQKHMSAVHEKIRRFACQHCPHKASTPGTQAFKEIILWSLFGFESIDPDPFLGSGSCIGYVSLPRL